MNLYDSPLEYNAPVGYSVLTIVYDSNLTYDVAGLGYDTVTLAYESGFTYDSSYFVYGGANFDVPMASTTFTTELNRLANRANYPQIADYLTPTHAANVWAGTTGLTLIAALNHIHNDTKPKTEWLALREVLNSIAGTTDLSETDALRSIV